MTENYRNTLQQLVEAAEERLKSYHKTCAIAILPKVIEDLKTVASTGLQGYKINCYDYEVPAKPADLKIHHFNRACNLLTELKKILEEEPYGLTCEIVDSQGNSRNDKYQLKVSWSK